MIQENLSDTELVDQYLQKDELVLWMHKNGRFSNTARLWVWLAIPFVFVWAAVGLHSILGGSENQGPPIYVTILVSTFVIAFACFMLWCAKRELNQDGNRIFIVTNKRVLVMNPHDIEDLKQAKIDNLGSISVKSSKHGDTLEFESAKFWDLNSFFQRHSEWAGLSDANQVKSIIEKRKAEIAQETPQ